MVRAGIALRAGGPSLAGAYRPVSKKRLLAMYARARARLVRNNVLRVMLVLPGARFIKTISIPRGAFLPKGLLPLACRCLAHNLHSESAEKQ